MKTNKNQFVIVSSKYGYDVFVAKSETHHTDGYTTAFEEEAEVFTFCEDNPAIKCGFFNTVSGFDGFEARAI